MKCKWIDFKGVNCELKMVEDFYIYKVKFGIEFFFKIVKLFVSFVNKVFKYDIL